jgi:hypothetical protein
MKPREIAAALFYISVIVLSLWLGFWSAGAFK